MYHPGALPSSVIQVWAAGTLYLGTHFTPLFCSLVSKGITATVYLRYQSNRTMEHRAKSSAVLYR